MAYLKDQSGNQLTDVSGNFLVTDDVTPPPPTPTPGRVRYVAFSMSILLAMVLTTLVIGG